MPSKEAKAAYYKAFDTYEAAIAKAAKAKSEAQSAYSKARAAYDKAYATYSKAKENDNDDQ